jgi:hypothetical protein
MKSNILPSLALVSITAAILTACTTGIVPAGPDTYMVAHSISAFSTVGRGMASNYQEASRWCAARGLVMVPVSTDQREPRAGQGMGTADLYFRALKPGDPEIKRGNVAAPNNTQRLEIR